MNKQLLAIIFLATLIFAPLSRAATDTTASNDPCGGSDALLALLNRPTIQDSACVVKPHKTVIEIGALYATLKGGGAATSAPQAMFRFGLPADSEVYLLAPNYVYQQISGWGPVAFGAKHEFDKTTQHIYSAEGTIILPSGSAVFGSAHAGGIINGIAAFQLLPNVAFTAMMGISSQALPTSAGGAYVTSVNPDFVIAWQPKPKWQWFGELYGQTKAAPANGVGVNVLAGVQYLITPRFEVDAEISSRVYGDLGGFNQYAGVGIGLLI